MKLMSLIVASFLLVSGPTTECLSKGFAQHKAVTYKTKQTAVIAKVLPTVVGITYDIVKKVDGEDIPTTIIGSGVIIDPRGYILTSSHVFYALENKEFTVTFYPQNNVYISGSAEVLVTDSKIDLALVKITSPIRPIFPGVKNFDLPYLRFADSDKVETGEEVIAIGHPYRVGWTVSKGIISHNNRYHPMVNLFVLQTDAAINPGNSGGPLLDRNGKIVGINFSIKSSDGHRMFVGLGFAVPSNTCVKFLNKHKELLK